MEKQILHKTNFRLMGIFMLLVGVAGITGSVLGGKELPWIVYGIFGLFVFFGLRMGLKNTTHAIYLQGGKLGWLVNGKTDKEVATNDIVGI